MTQKRVSHYTDSETRLRWLAEWLDEGVSRELVEDLIAEGWRVQNRGRLEVDDRIFYGIIVDHPDEDLTTNRTQLILVAANPFLDRTVPKYARYLTHVTRVQNRPCPGGVIVAADQMTVLLCRQDFLPYFRRERSHE